MIGPSFGMGNSGGFRNNPAGDRTGIFNRPQGSGGTFTIPQRPPMMQPPMMNRPPMMGDGGMMGGGFGRFAPPMRTGSPFMNQVMPNQNPHAAFNRIGLSPSPAGNMGRMPIMRGIGPSMGLPRPNRPQGGYEGPDSQGNKISRPGSSIGPRMFSR